MVRRETSERCQCTEYRLLNEKLMQLWEQLNAGDIGAKQLLCGCGKLYKPIFKKKDQDELELQVVGEARM